jgi:UDP-N-acetylmuramyl tripeptide synthase
VQVTGPVVRDSREVVPGSLFVAFRGERVDGHDFAPAVVARAHAGDTVLVAGKGHEQGQDIAGVVRPFDDRQVLREAIQQTQG